MSSPEAVLGEEAELAFLLVGLLDLNLTEVVTMEPSLVVFLVSIGGLSFWPEAVLASDVVLAAAEEVFAGGPLLLTFLLTSGLDLLAVRPLTLRGLVFGESMVELPLRLATGLVFGDPLAAVPALCGERGLDLDGLLATVVVL